MKLEFPFLFFFFFVAFLFIIVVTWLKSFSSFGANKNLPPQPWKLPVLGHIHHLFGEQPHRALRNLAQKLGPIFHLQLGQISATVISSPLIAKEIFKTHDLSFASRIKLLAGEIVAYNYTDIVFSPYGDYWRQMRKICVLEILSAKKVHSLRSIREGESWKLVEFISMEGSQTINLTEKIFSMMNIIICKAAIGTGCKDQDTLIALIQESVSLSSGFDLSDLFPSIKVLPLITGTRNKMMKIRKKMDLILDSIISDHQEHRPVGHNKHENEDILDVLLRLKDEGGLESPISFDNIKAVLLDMFAAGTETCAVLIQWVISELIKNPRVMRKVQDEARHVLKGKLKIHESEIQDLNYLKLVIKETLRLHPPAPLLSPRECRETCEIGGYHIPAKSTVIVNIWKMGRDPDYWVDPETFIPERFSESSISMMGTDFEYLPFGAGRRICPGITLGMANVELPLAMLLYHFNWDLPNGETSENLDMSESFGATLNRKNDLLLVAKPCIIKN